MDCTDIKASLSALIDDEVEPQTRHALERHLAECRVCRDLLGEAEANDALVALDAGHAPADRSVQELEQKVLARTVNAHRPRGRWTTWWGWLAAAASLLLAASIWVIDRHAEVSKGGGADEQIVPTTYRAGPHIRSWTLKGRPALAPAARAEATAARGPISREPLSSNDAETLESAALVLGLIERADDHTFADLETAREILEYDELLPRLSRVRGHLPAEDRPALLSAESILYRVVHGPLSLGELTQVRETVARLDLAERIGAMADRPPTESSL